VDNIEVTFQFEKRGEANAYCLPPTPVVFVVIPTLWRNCRNQYLEVSEAYPDETRFFAYWLDEKITHEILHLFSREELTEPFDWSREEEIISEVSKQMHIWVGSDDS
jgi:hypothetical protein